MEEVPEQQNSELRACLISAVHHGWSLLLMTAWGRAQKEGSVISLQGGIYARGLTDDTFVLTTCAWHLDFSSGNTKGKEQENTPLRDRKGKSDSKEHGTLSLEFHFKFGADEQIEIQKTDYAAAHLQIPLPESPNWLDPECPWEPLLGFSSSQRQCSGVYHRAQSQQVGKDGHEQLGSQFLRMATGWAEEPSGDYHSLGIQPWATKCKALVCGLQWASQ